VLLLSQYVETHHAMELLGEGATGVGYLLKDRVVDLSEFTDAVRRVGAEGRSSIPRSYLAFCADTASETPWSC
jgi:hypothetical protein